MSFLSLDHLVLHHGLEDVVALVVVVDDAGHLPTVELGLWVVRVNYLLACQSVRLPLQLAF